MEKAKNLTILLNAEDLVKLQVLQRKMCNTATGVIRYLINEWHEKNFAQNNTTVLTPAPVTPAAPPAWVCPSPEEIRRLEPYQALTLIMEHWDEMDNECQQAAADTQEVTYEQAEELAHCND